MQQTIDVTTVEMKSVEHVLDAPQATTAEPRERAFTKLMRSLREPAFRLALAMLNDSHEAEDVVQDAFVIAWRKFHTLNDPARARAWFLGVVANECRNARRRWWRVDVRLGIPVQLTVASGVDGALAGADLRRAISRLRHKDQVVVVLYFYLDMPLSEVAETVGSSLPATRARLYRSIERLRPGIEMEEALR